VVSAPLKNISQLRLLFPIDGKITNGPNHQPVMYFKLNLANEMGMCITHRKKKHFLTEFPVASSCMRIAQSL
jgi:hypothetical protein